MSLLLSFIFGIEVIASKRFLRSYLRIIGKCHSLLGIACLFSGLVSCSEIALYGLLSYSCRVVSYRMVSSVIPVVWSHTVWSPQLFLSCGLIPYGLLSYFCRVVSYRMVSSVIPVVWSHTVWSPQLFLSCGLIPYGLLSYFCRVVSYRMVSSVIPVVSPQLFLPCGFLPIPVGLITYGLLSFFCRVVSCRIVSLVQENIRCLYYCHIVFFILSKNYKKSKM